MVSTRSSGKSTAIANDNSTEQQTRLEDFGAGDTQQSTTAAKAGQKRKKPSTSSSTKPAAAVGSQKSNKDLQAPPPPPRPSAANAEAIKGNTTVSPSLPEASKRRKPNAASLAPEMEGGKGDGAGIGEKDEKKGTKAKAKSKSGGRNVGGEARRAVERQAHFAARADGGNQGEDKHDEEGAKSLQMEQPIMINRSPVLQLWAACVAEFLYGEEVGWETCLSMGAAIAALCAVSKGKAIGKIEPKDETDEQVAKKEDKKKKAQQDSEEYYVMGFPLHVKAGKAQVSGSPKNVNEGQFIGKFGGEDNYGRVRETMKQALKGWSGHDEELNKKAFGLYEKFRPNVPAGGGGWGKKGELSLAKVEGTVRRS